MRFKWLIIIVSGIVLSFFIVGTTYAWYNVFSNEVEAVASLEIMINDGGKGVTIENAFPLNDSEGKQQQAYSFTIKNNGNVTGQYKLFIEESAFNVIDDGCTPDMLLARSQLKYQLKLNGEEIALGSLSDIKNNLLEIRSIKAGVINRYELRVWVPIASSDTDWMNKHYHYHVTAKTVSANVEGKE